MRKVSFLLLGLMGLFLLAAWSTWVVAEDTPKNNPAESERTAASAIGYRNTLLVQMRVADLDRAVRFYREVLDFDVRVRRDDLQWAELTFGISGVAVGLGAGSEVKGSGSVSLNIGVRDIDASRKLLEERGVVFTAATVTVPEKVRLADFTDPDGNRIRLAQSLVPEGK